VGCCSRVPPRKRPLQLAAMKCQAASSAAAVLLLACVGAVSGQDGPVDKVVNLLKELKARMTSDQTKEQGLYDKYACWCETTTDRKAKAVAKAEADLKYWGEEIMRLSVESSVEGEKIKKLEKDISENIESQELATKLRQDENAKYQSETAEIMQAMTALRKAIKVLFGATSLVQQGTASRVHAAILAAVNSLPMRAAAKLPMAQLAELRKVSSGLVQENGKAAYAPQSATIQGILQDMYSTFAKDLMDQTNAEAIANTNYESLMATKIQAQIDDEKSLTTAKKEKAEAEAMLADANQAFEETSDLKKADIEFFNEVTAGCEAKTEEWKLRRSLRVEEMDGVTQAITILTTDTAKELFPKAIKPGQETMFLQVTSVSSANPAVQKAFSALKAQATRSKSLRLAALATQVRMTKAGHFDKVIEAIDKMLVTLVKEQEADTKKRDECKVDYQNYKSTKGKLEWKISNDEAQITKMQNLVDKHEDEKDDTIEEMAEIGRTVESMTATRTQENEDFEEAKKDDEDAIVILKDARAYLSKFYEKQGIKVASETSMLQQTPSGLEDELKAPDATFDKVSSRAGESKGIISILSMIIEDLEAEIRNGIKDEKASQEAYDKTTAALRNTNSTLEEKRISLEQAITDRKADKLTAENSKIDNTADRDENQQAKDDITVTCDEVINEFTMRMKKREAETEGLTQAKEALTQFFEAPALLEKRTSDQGKSTLLSRLQFSGIESPALRLRH